MWMHRTMSVCDAIIISHPDPESGGVNRRDGTLMEQSGRTREMTTCEEKLRGPS